MQEIDAGVSIVPRQRSAFARELGRGAFVISQDFSDCRRKVFDAGARYDDAVASTVSFFCNA